MNFGKLTYRDFKKSVVCLTWGERILDLRHATGYTQKEFSRVSGIDLTTIKRLETDVIAVEIDNNPRKVRLQKRDEAGLHYFPHIETIRKIRNVEGLFAAELKQFRAHPRLYDRLCRPRRRPVPFPERPPDLLLQLQMKVDEEPRSVPYHPERKRRKRDEK